MQNNYEVSYEAPYTSWIRVAEPFSKYTRIRGTALYDSKPSAESLKKCVWPFVLVQMARSLSFLWYFCSFPSSNAMERFRSSSLIQRHVFETKLKKKTEIPTKVEDLTHSIFMIFIVNGTSIAVKRILRFVLCWSRWFSQWLLTWQPIGCFISNTTDGKSHFPSHSTVCQRIHSRGFIHLIKNRRKYLVCEREGERILENGNFLIWFLCCHSETYSNGYKHFSFG